MTNKYIEKYKYVTTSLELKSVGEFLSSLLSQSLIQLNIFIALLFHLLCHWLEANKFPPHSGGGSHIRTSLIGDHLIECLLQLPHFTWGPNFQAEYTNSSDENMCLWTLMITHYGDFKFQSLNSQIVVRIFS